MIEILPQSSESCLAVQFEGKITGQEYQQFLDAIGDHLKTSTSLDLVLVLKDFDFYGDFEAAKKDLKFAFHEYKHIRRAAFVGDQNWLEWFARLIGPFTKAEEKNFASGQLEAAIDWARA